MLLPAISWPGGSPENTGIIAGVIVGAYLSALWLAAILWTIRDIRERSQDPVTQFIAVATVILFSLAGWVLYLVLRPGITIAEVYDRQLEEEALLQDLQHQLACPQCGVDVQEDFVACPHCATALKALCHSCSRPLPFTWRICPWCSAARQSAPSLTTPEPAAPLPAQAATAPESPAPPADQPTKPVTDPGSSPTQIATAPIPPLAGGKEPTSSADPDSPSSQPRRRRILQRPEAEPAATNGSPQKPPLASPWSR